MLKIVHDVVEDGKNDRMNLDKGRRLNFKEKDETFKRRNNGKAKPNSRES